MLRVILAAFVLAVKFNEDLCYKFDYYSYTGGVTPKELAMLEYNFLELIEYELYVNRKNYIHCLEFLEGEMKQDKSTKEI